MNKKIAEKMNNVVFEEEIRQEFKNASDRGESNLNQIKAELGELNYILSSPIISEEDTTFKNINPDQQGEAYGLAYQANEPLDTAEKIEERDEDRWELNSASADDYEKTNKEIEE